MKHFFSKLSEMREQYPNGPIVQLRVLMPDDSMFEFEGSVPEAPTAEIIAMLRTPNPALVDEEPTRGIRGIARETRD